MIKHKILSALAAVAITAGMVTSVQAVPVSNSLSNKETTDAIVTFCKKAYERFNKGDGTYLEKGMAQLDQNGKNVVALACVAYGQGFQDGRSSVYIT